MLNGIEMVSNQDAQSITMKVCVCFPEGWQHGNSAQCIFHIVTHDFFAIACNFMHGWVQPSSIALVARSILHPGMVTFPGMVTSPDLARSGASKAIQVGSYRHPLL